MRAFSVTDGSGNTLVINIEQIVRIELPANSPSVKIYLSNGEIVENQNPEVRTGLIQAMNLQL